MPHASVNRTLAGIQKYVWPIPVMRLGWRCLVFLSFVCLTLSSVFAVELPCNIPVFRFALERWQPDPYQLTLVHPSNDDENSSQSQQKLSKFVESHPSTSRLKAISNQIESGSESDARDAKLLAELPKEMDSTQLFVQFRASQGRLLTAWQGDAKNFNPKRFFSSPAREEVASRLLRGHSVIWLVISGADEDRSKQLTERIQEKLLELEKEITLPEGIGLPGSELFSSIPLSLKFSALNISRENKEEATLVSLLRNFQPDAFHDGAPLVLPIFGKGRGLEVIPGDRVDENLVEDLTFFLCGACSCQVKDLNPGFDLPFMVDWNKEIFGEDADELPPADGPGQQRGGRPELVPIAPGNRKNKRSL